LRWRPQASKLTRQPVSFDIGAILSYTGYMRGETTSPLEQITSVIILAGGQSRRMGRDKTLLAVDGEPLVHRAVRILGVLSDDLIIVANDVERYQPLALSARFVPDERPGVGALMGIYSGLRAAHYPQALIVACDMPFLNSPLLNYMLTQSDGYDVVIPRVGGLLEPLHAIYGKSCLPFIRDLLDKSQRKIIAFFDEVRVRYIEEPEIDQFDPKHLSFVNVNRFEDWEMVRRLLGQEGPEEAVANA
jgi:molybdopterin-guanine dinucleotide biosynthesis protein A